MKENEEKYCCDCCWFKHECVDGYGVCYGRDDRSEARCDDEACDCICEEDDMLNACETIEKSHICNDTIRAAARALSRYYRVMSKI